MESEIWLNRLVELRRQVAVLRSEMPTLKTYSGIPNLLREVETKLSEIRVMYQGKLSQKRMSRISKWLHRVYAPAVMEAVRCLYFNGNEGGTSCRWNG